MSSPHTSTKPAFTLVEMLIVIVIIGILAAALIPRLTGIQARARDTARDADLRNITTAIETYKIDNGSYPTPVLANISRQVALSDLMISYVFAQTEGSSLDTLGSSVLSSYLKSIPRDPSDKGVKADEGGACIDEGDSYGYLSDGSSYYAITSLSESKKGNASSCGDTIDNDNNGGYKKVGEGLTINIQSAGDSTYPDPSQWTPAGQFTVDGDIISAYNGPTGVGVIIPAEINGVAIDSISVDAFYYKQLTSVTIPNSVSYIGESAFAENGLTSVTIPNSVSYIGQAAFNDNKLTSVTIPNSVTSIGNQVFHLNNLTSVTIPSSVTSIGRGAFLSNGPNQNSSDITNFVPSTNQTRNLVDTTWVKQ